MGNGKETGGTGNRMGSPKKGQVYRERIVEGKIKGAKKRGSSNR